MSYDGRRYENERHDDAYQRDREEENIFRRGFYPESPDDDDDRSEFADPGGNSSLRAATRDNPRDQPCPDCGRPNVLTREDARRHYCCNRCADRKEGGGYGRADY